MNKEWNELYDSVAKLVGTDTVHVTDKITCYVSEKGCPYVYEPMFVEKIRHIYQHHDPNEGPKDEIWVTANDGKFTTRTLAIARNSNGKNTDISNVRSLFNRIIALFSLPMANDEQWANEALES